MKRVKRSLHLPLGLNAWLTEEAGRRGLSTNAIVVLLLEQEQQRQAGRPAQRPPAPPAAPDGGDVLDFD